MEQLEEDTQERLAAATQAYRDVLFEHILEGGLSDMARRTRAMLRALEERLGSARGPLRGVDPDVQKRSLEAFRKLEKAVRALCGASL